jgi:hypothetical protein
VIASAGVLAVLAGLMLHFYIAKYTYLESALAGSVAIYLWTRPAVRSLAVTLLIGAAFWVIYSALQGQPSLGACPAFLGLGSLGSLGLAVLWSAPDQRQADLDTCLTASMFPFFLVVAGFSLAVTSIVHPKTYDVFLYAFDEQLGGQPSFLAGRLLARFGALRQVCYFGYESLPLAMAIAFAMERSRPGRHLSSLMPAFAVAAAGGFLLYNLYPAVGPLHVFGAQFPYSPPPAGSSPFQLVAAGEAPRNAMPSVHISMALLILWNSRPWPKVFRVVAAALLGITILATLGFGEHYLVDLFVAVPFAALAQGLASHGVPWRNAARIACVATGTLLVLAWLSYLRLPSPPLVRSGALAWSLLLGSALTSAILESRLSRVAARSGVSALTWINERERVERLRVPG